MNTQEKVIAILAATHDGDDLHLHQVTLCRAALDDASKRETAAAVDALHQQIVAGEFEGRHNWFHGVRHLTRERMGYVAWRGRNVEHYSYGHRCEEERVAAVRLGKICEMLEAKGFPVTGRTVLYHDTFCDAPKDTPWLPALLSYYAFLADSHGKPACVIFGLPDRAAVAVEADGPTTTLRYAQEDDSGFGTGRMLHQLQDEGYKSCTPHVPSYTSLVALFTEIGLAPDQIDGILSLGCPEPESTAPFDGVAQ